MAGLHSVHGDGVSDQFFHLLWSKDELNFGPTINIPDTVIFKFGQAVAWYFTGVDGKLKKKNKQNLVNVRIEEAFTRHVIGSDIVAYYISTETDDAGDVSNTSIEYFDRKAFHDFLYNRWKEHSGLLQRFIEPKGTQNSLVRAIWSPKVCLLERRQNNKQLHDTRYGLYERAVTYEGPEYFSAAAPLRGSILPSQVQRICENVVSHIAEVSFQKQCICRMVLNFKVDAKDRIWLLWSSSLRLTSEMTGGEDGLGGRRTAAPLNIDSIVKLPSHVKLEDRVSHSDQGKALTAQETCLSCAGKHPKDQFHPVAYKNIISHFEHVISLLTADSRFRSGGVGAWPPDPTVVMAAGGVGFGSVAAGGGSGGGRGEKDKDAGVTEEDVLIPPVLRQIHPKLSAHVFKRYRRDPLFLYKTAKVCENCYLVYAELASAMASAGSGSYRAKAEPEIPTYMTGALTGGDSAALTMASGYGGDSGWDIPSQAKSSKRGSRARRGGGPSQASTMKAPPPSFPSAIRTAETIPDSYMQQQYGFDPSGQQPATDDGEGAVETVEELVQQREDAFFREISTDPRMRSGHPLTHMVTTYNKMENVNRPPDMSRTLAAQSPATAAAAAAAAPTGVSPYTQRLDLVETVLHPGRKGRKGRGSGGGGGSGSGGGGGGGGAATTATGHTGNTAMSKASSRHRDFLLQTLRDVENQLTTPSALKSFVESHTLTEAYPKVPSMPPSRSSDPYEDGGSLPGARSLEDPADMVPPGADAVAALAAPPFAGGPQVPLLSKGHDIEGKHVAVKCTEDQSGARPIIVFEVVYALKSMQWRLTADPVDLGLQAGAFEAMHPEEKEQLCDHLIQRLRFQGEDAIMFALE